MKIKVVSLSALLLLASVSCSSLCRVPQGSRSAAAEQKSSLQLISGALKSGEIDEDTATLYRVYSVFDEARLPPETLETYDTSSSTERRLGPTPMPAKASKAPAANSAARLPPPETADRAMAEEAAMKLAIVGAGYSPGEADQLRRDMAAWRKNGRLARHRQKLIDGFARNGIAREFAERLYAQILGFGEYGFPESHSASLAPVQTCWPFLAKMEAVPVSWHIGRMLRAAISAFFSNVSAT